MRRRNQLSCGSGPSSAIQVNSKSIDLDVACICGVKVTQPQTEWFVDGAKEHAIYDKPTGDTRTDNPCEANQTQPWSQQ